MRVLTLAPWIRGGLAGLAAAVVVGLAPAAAHAALAKNVTSGSVTLPNSASASTVALTGLDITKSFVVCSTRTSNTVSNTMLATCQLDNNGSGGAAELTITPAAAPGAGALIVQYYVIEFTAGVSVQRGSTTFTGTTLTADSAPSLSAVDCTKSFVLTSVIDTDTVNTRDEVWEVQGILGTSASPCTSGTTTSLELTRNLGRFGTTVTVQWQVVTLEGASVQRGTVCIGASGTCTLGSGATAGTSNRITLGTAVDTTKTFILMTSKGGSSIAGVEGLYRVRTEFTSTGSSVTVVQFARSLNSTLANQQVNIAYEVVSLSDGSAVQTSGASPSTVTGTTASVNVTLSTIVDTTRTVPFFSVSGGSAATATVYDDTAFVGVLTGSNGGAASSRLTFTRTDTTNVGTNSMAWFAVSFFRCTTPSAVTYDTLCTLGASTTGTGATVNWSSVNTVLILKSTSAIGSSPTNGTTYVAGNTIGGISVVYSGSTATDTSFSDSGLTTGTTYHYKMWAKAGPTGTCTASPCYVQGTEVTITPRSGSTTWSSIVVGGAALNPVVGGTQSGTPPVSFGSNAGKIISVNATTGAFASTPANTVGATQGYVSVFPFENGTSDSVVAADQSGWVYSLNPSTGAFNWIVKLNADAVQAAVSTYLRGFFSSAMTTAYPGSYDLIFVATYNNTGSGGFTNNKVYALRSDTGATLWTFNPSGLSSGLCPSGCSMDQVPGQPWVDYLRDRLYVASRPGNLGTQNSLWVLDIANSGALLAVFGGGADYTTAPTQSFAGNTLFIGDQTGTLHFINLSALTQTTNLLASGTSFKGFVWEDFGGGGIIYFVTSDGNVWRLDPPYTSVTWKTKPVSGGTVSQLVESDVKLWVGGSDGNLYQLNLGTGTVEKTFVVGAGSLQIGPVSTDTGNELFMATSDGTMYKITLTSGSLP